MKEFNGTSEPTDTVPWIKVESALCVWEAMCDWRATYMGLDEIHPMLGTWEDLGSAEMRHLAINIGILFEDAYEQGNAENDERWDGLTYDWEIIPAMLSCVEWDGAFVRVPDAEVLIKAADERVAEMNARFDAIKNGMSDEIE